MNSQPFSQASQASHVAIATNAMRPQTNSRIDSAQSSICGLCTIDQPHMKAIQMITTAVAVISQYTCDMLSIHIALSLPVDWSMKTLNDFGLIPQLNVRFVFAVWRRATI